MVEAVLCSVFLAADKPKSRRNVELQPVFSQRRQELVQSRTAVLSCFTLCITTCVAVSVCVWEQQRETETLEEVCSAAFQLCQWNSCEKRGVLFCSTLWFYMFCTCLACINRICLDALWLYLLAVSFFSACFPSISVAAWTRGSVLECSLSVLTCWDLSLYLSANAFSNPHFVQVHTLNYFFISLHSLQFDSLSAWLRFCPPSSSSLFYFILICSLYF